MKKILLSIVALIAFTTTTLFGACTQDVNMSGNKIESLGAGSADSDAVNYEQTLKKTIVDVLETNASILASYNNSTYNVQVTKVGALCYLQGLIQNKSGGALNSSINFGNIPVGYRPTWFIHFTDHSNGTTQNPTGHISSSTGAITIITSNMEGGFLDTKYIPLSFTYLCQ